MVQPAVSPRRRTYARLDESDARMMLVVSNRDVMVAAPSQLRSGGLSALQIALLLMMAATVLLIARALLSPAGPAMLPRAVAASQSLLTTSPTAPGDAVAQPASGSTRPLPPPLASAAVSGQVGPRGIAALSALGDSHRTAMAANGQFDLLAQPSVSVGVIRSELQSVNSPLLSAIWPDHKDAAQYIWDAGYVDGVDPAILMAFFWHESHYGTQGIANQTDSVGNLRPLANQPELNGYRYYRSWAEGVDDAYRLLRSYAVNGAPTVATAIPVWAPPTDNNDDSSYIADVQQRATQLYLASVH